MKILLCPAGNSVYMSSGDAISGIVVTFAVSAIIVFVGIALALFIVRRYHGVLRDLVSVLFFIVGVTIVLAVLNVWQFLQFMW